MARDRWVWIGGWRTNRYSSRSRGFARVTWLWRSSKYDCYRVPWRTCTTDAGSRFLKTVPRVQDASKYTNQGNAVRESTLLWTLGWTKLSFFVLPCTMILNFEKKNTRVEVATAPEPIQQRRVWGAYSPPETSEASDKRAEHSSLVSGTIKVTLFCVHGNASGCLETVLLPQIKDETEPPISLDILNPTKEDRPTGGSGNKQIIVGAPVAVCTTLCVPPCATVGHCF